MRPAALASSGDDDALGVHERLESRSGVLLRDAATSVTNWPHTSSSSFWVCSRFSGLILSVRNGSTALLYLPWRTTWTPTPYLSSAPLKNVGVVASPGRSISPNGLR